MKRLLLIILIALLTACNTTYQMTSTTVSFENFNREGFLITTSSIVGSYQSLGIVSVECRSGFVAQSAKVKVRDTSDGIYSSPSVRHTGQYGDCNKADLIDGLYAQAIDLKANALIDVKFQDYMIKESSGYRVIHSATGLAVKTK